MRRKAAAILMIMMALLAAGCRAEQDEVTLRIGVALYSQEDTFISTVVQHLQQLALEEETLREIKINLNTLDAGSSQAVQNEQVDRFLDQGYDAICVNIVDRTAAAVIIDKAQAAGVPVIFFNREPVREDLDRYQHAYYVGTQAAAAGVLQGEMVLRAWRGGELDKNGDGVLQYVMLEGEPGHQDALLRTEHSLRRLSEAGVRMEKLESAVANWQRGQAGIRMRQWIEDHDGRIEAVLANNDDMALGAIDAYREAGIERLPFIVGVDATPPALEAVAEGSLKGTVQNDAEGQARCMLSLACALIRGEDPDQAAQISEGKYVWLEYTPVTEKNYKEFTGDGY